MYLVSKKRLFLGSVFVATWVFGAWSAAKLLIVTAPLEHADVILVLSGSETYQERTEQAARLYHQHRAPRIIITNDNAQGGWSKAQQTNPFFYERAKDNLLRLGVSENDIELLQEPVSSTYGEAVLVKKYIEKNKIDSILLVTSAYHSRRSLLTFRHLLVSIGTKVGLQPVEVGIQTPETLTWWLHLRGWQMVPSEYAKIFYYRLRYL